MLSQSLLLLALGVALASSNLFLPGVCPQCDPPFCKAITDIRQLYGGKDVRSGRLERMLEEVNSKDLRARLSELTIIPTPNPVNCIDGLCIRLSIFCPGESCNNPQQVTFGDPPYLSCFDSSKPSMFIFPGWLERGGVMCDFSWTAAKHYCKQGDYNVFVVDYSGCTGYYSYVLAVCIAIREVVRDMLCFIQRLGINPCTIRIQGESLGAQVGAAVADGIRKEFETKPDFWCKIAELVCYDPAGPGFDWPPEFTPFCDAHVVSGTDAVHVIVFRTNGFPGGFGLSSSIPGAMVLNINGGTWQCWCGPFLVAAPASYCNHVSVGFVWAYLLANGPVLRMASTRDPWSLNACRTDLDVILEVGDGGEYVIGEFYLAMYFWEICDTIVRKYTECFENALIST